MCGIAGVLDYDGTRATTRVRSMLRAMRHRGEVVCQDEIGGCNGFVLGTNRLAIESRKAEPQPIQPQNSPVIVGYNGEVYNWRSLATTLRSEISSDITSEPQAIAESIVARGPAAILTFDGMFAVIWNDPNSGSVYFARDPFGIKPLYYAFAPRQLLISSELKALAQFDDVKLVYEVSPGTWCCATQNSIKRKTINVVSYWQPPDRIDQIIDTNALLNCLDHSVAGCIASSQRDIAFHLSGGVDSSAVLALALRHRPRGLHAITVGHENSTDVQAATRFADSQGIDLIHCKPPDEEEIFSNVPTIIKQIESFEPNLVRQGSAHYYMARAASEYARIVLCGEGADELFCGYPEFLAAPDDHVFTLRDRFVKDLHRTQLQRVDRISMMFTLETRVPFLRQGPASLALGCGRRSEFLDNDAGLAGTKLALRESLRGVLADEWRLRPKVVLSEGMGLGGNDPRAGLFSKLVDQAMPIGQVREIQESFPQWGLRDAEEAYYFSIYHKYGYDKLASAKDRVLVNAINSVQRPASI